MSTAVSYRVTVTQLRRSRRKL